MVLTSSRSFFSSTVRSSSTAQMLPRKYACLACSDRRTGLGPSFVEGADQRTALLLFEDAAGSTSSKWFSIFADQIEMPPSIATVCPVIRAPAKPR
jgi:hypothetical protein